MMAKRGGYTAQRISQNMTAPKVVETPDSDSASIYMQRWKRVDGKVRRMFNVLALDQAHAITMGQIRLSEKYRQDPINWVNETNTVLERQQSLVTAVLTVEGEEERSARADEWFRRKAAKKL